MALVLMDGQLNHAFLGIIRRAESNERSKLVETFVDTGPLLHLLGSADHQVIYGRRGTGKTHALLYLAERRASKGDVPIYVDMRLTGSNNSIWSDVRLPVTERATRLLMDTLGALHESLRSFVYGSSPPPNAADLAVLLEELAEASTQITIVGTVTDEQSKEVRAAEENSDHWDVKATGGGVDGSIGTSNRNSAEERMQNRRSTSGEIRHRVHFGAVSSVLAKIAREIGSRKIWLLLDEWSVVPLDLQPYLADLIRRSILPVRGVIVKIGAIEQRSNFRLHGLLGDYVGLELGADMSADVNLDDFMVFDNDAPRATAFFKELLFRHFKSVANDIGLVAAPTTADDLVRVAFTQRNAFEEFVRASEGVPRDAINIIALAAQRAGDAALSMEHVRSAAKSWFQRDKEAALTANSTARDFLHWIIKEVIAHRRARAFLLQTTARHELIDALFDARLLHLLKRNIAAHDQPGVRFDVYKIDYGCYVDLLTTVRAPQGLLPSGEDDGAYVDVPPDDYRAIRRAILDPGAFAGLSLAP